MHRMWRRVFSLLLTQMRVKKMTLYSSNSWIFESFRCRGSSKICSNENQRHRLPSRAPFRRFPQTRGRTFAHWGCGENRLKPCIQSTTSRRNVRTIRPSDVNFFACYLKKRACPGRAPARPRAAHARAAHARAVRREGTEPLQTIYDTLAS